MAKYRLLSKHYIHDQVLAEGTIVGDETSFPIAEGGVTPEMEGIDEPAIETVKKVREAAFPKYPPSPQLGLLYLEPSVQEALVELAKAQAGAKTPGATQAREAPSASPKR